MGIRLRKPGYWTIVMLLLLIVGASVAMLVRLPSEQIMAQQRWAQRPFTDYRLEITEQDALQSMTRSYYAPNASGTSPDQQTVSSLFNLLAQPHSSASPCSASPAHCPLTVTCQWEATYHPALGYPQKMVHQCHEHPDWLNIHLWLQPWLIWEICQNRNGACSRLIYEQTLHVEVTLLP